MVQDYRRSLTVPQKDNRFNLLLIQPEQGLSFVSFDPVEQTLISLPFPPNTVIRSRTRGEYDVASLYKLGDYQGDGGMFARQKIQGFMRVPIPAYVVVGGDLTRVRRELRRGLLAAIVSGPTNLSRLDAWTLWMRTYRYQYREISQDELVRAAVLEQVGGRIVYHFDRLQEYVGKRFFDWQLGARNVTVAIVNESGQDGLGTALADFLGNMGLDVVMVRSGNTQDTQTSRWQVGDRQQGRELAFVFDGLFAMGEAKVEKVPEEYRATVLIVVGKDAEELF